MFRIKLLLIITLWPIIGLAQLFIDFRDDFYWVDNGYGVFLKPNGSADLAASYSLNLIKGSTLLQLKLTQQEKTRFLALTPEEQYVEGSFLIGKAFSWNKQRVIFAAGMGATIGISPHISLPEKPWPGFFEPHRYGNNHFIVSSLPVEVRYQYMPFQIISLELAVYANLNRQQSLYGILFHVGIGRMRERIGNWKLF